jgi:GNAT superfamily N-acetyltransferase
MRQASENMLVLVECVDLAQIEVAIDIITNAFATDPAMVHFVGDAEQGDIARRNIVTAIIYAHFRAQEPVFLLLENQQAVGAALVDIKRAPLFEIFGMLHSWQQWRRLPKGCLKRMNTYRSLSRRGSDSNSNYLTMIGIEPEQQGKGFGGRFIALLESQIRPLRGWSLDTENSANVLLYEKLGFTLVNTVVWDALSIYQMHKSTT